MIVVSHRRVLPQRFCKIFITDFALIINHGCIFVHNIFSFFTNIAQYMNADFFIESYKVHHLIEKGGQAEVYCASKDSSLYAIKVYMQNDTVSQQQFVREKQIHQVIKHEGILSCLEIIENAVTFLSTQGQKLKNIIIMPYMQNGDLMNQIISNGYFSQQMVRKISKKLISSISYLKKNQLLHCDIKPENILLDCNYNPLLIDFGYFKNFLENKNYQIVHSYYIAPQIKKGKQHSEKSEMFSFGIVLFILHVGTVPFQSTKHTDQVYRLLLEGKFKSFWEHFQKKTERTFSKQFKNMMNRLLQTSPTRRFSTNQFITCEWMDQGQISDQIYFQQFEKRRNKSKDYLQEQTTTAIKQKDFQRANSQQI